MRSSEPVLVDPDEARRAAEEILSRPEYQEPQPTLVDRALTALSDFLGQTFATLTGGGAGNLIGIVVVVVVLALAGWLLARALGTPWRRSLPPEPDGAVHGTTAPDDPRVWAAEAERCSAAGDHRGALRCHHQALLATLVRSGALDQVPARTSGELRRELAGRRPDLDATIGSVTERFDAVWYGEAPVDAADVEAFARDAGAVAAADLRPAVPA